MMNQISIKDVRRAILHVDQGNSGIPNLQDVPDEELLDYSFLNDLHMGNIRVTNVVADLQKHNDFELPFEVLRKRPDDKVKTFMDAINLYLKESNKD